jgi:hypothetical protein
MSGSDSTSDAPIVSTEEEVLANDYDWDDPDCNEYDADDPFIAPEFDDIAAWANTDGEGIILLSPKALASAERQGRPARNRRPPVRYTPSPLPESAGCDMFSYNHLADDDDGVSSADECDSQFSNSEWSCNGGSPKPRGSASSSSSSSSSSSDDDVESPPCKKLRADNSE